MPQMKRGTTMRQTHVKGRDYAMAASLNSALFQTAKAANMSGVSLLENVSGIRKTAGKPCTYVGSVSFSFLTTRFPITVYGRRRKGGGTDNFRSQGGLTKHVNSKHNENSTLAGMAKVSQLHTFVRHPHLSEPVPRQPKSDLSESCGNPWLPFNDRLQYEWAYYHYVRLQSSAEDIRQGLDLWGQWLLHTIRWTTTAATVVPWKSAKEMDNTIDSISDRNQRTLPRWMQETYKLNVRNILSVFEEQLALKEFDGQFEYTPYKEYNAKGHRVYSNLMSGNWAFHTISQDKNTEGSMFVPIVAGE
ncbi:hypothetical protein EDB83DRAFT_2318440 [Lactarius deliciosus]|nr:hypothetical protein EDB83DRAFT_2318440 [Lactarius deliciosus]